MCPIPFDDLHRSARKAVDHFVERPKEHAEVSEAEAVLRLRVARELGGIAVAPTELAQILGANGLHTLSVDFLDARQMEVARHEQIPPSEGEENRIFARTLGGLMMGNEGQGEAARVRHSRSLPDLAGRHRESPKEARSFSGLLLGPDSADRAIMQEQSHVRQWMPRRCEFGSLVRKRVGLGVAPLEYRRYLDLKRQIGLKFWETHASGNSAAVGPRFRRPMPDALISFPALP